MVDLPSIPNEVPQLRAPQSRVSGADIAAPFAMLGNNLDKAGEIVEKDIAVPFAEKAGREAVTTGPDGEPIIQKMPIFGAASAAYMRAAKMTALAQMQPEIENHLAELKLKFPNDPNGFKTAAGTYTKEYTDKITVVQTDHTNVQNALVSLQSRLSEINERGASLARQGGTGTAEYERLHGDREAIYKELASRSAFSFPVRACCAGIESKPRRRRDRVRRWFRAARICQQEKPAAGAKGVAGYFLGSRQREPQPFAHAAQQG
jgi:hypothetical protein